MIKLASIKANPNATVVIMPTPAEKILNIKRPQIPIAMMPSNKDPIPKLALSTPKIAKGKIACAATYTKSRIKSKNIITGRLRCITT